ncbi:hypothetical protein [Aurantimonas sp. 22II-16-19i]|uniref:hypothetical protein n=1 Tax=Aurantimonas sp. 22II-16-19i TaxID=1317114 RepID=UPI0009F7FA09|nr:hypothetical protein [Aurantimonas sp. 22II-16-19i]ORE98763.1 hypothetical protein ATO4_00315 [Aurantimonas sp. 22II-16-19i]
MPDSDTDPRMMRAQQDADTPETVPVEEGRREDEASDSDVASGRERRAAIAGQAADEEQMEAILRQNRQARPSAVDAGTGTAGGSRKSLVRHGRSLLGG